VVDGWDTSDIEEIRVGARRMRVGRRRARKGPNPLTVTLVVLVLLAAAAGGGYLLFFRDGNKGIPDPAVVATGARKADLGPNNTVTIGLEVRNATNLPVTLLQARIVAPAGLTSTALTIMQPGTDNAGFDLTGDLPPSMPVELGTNDNNRSAIVAARFTVDCAGLLAPGASGEQIFVTIQVAGQQREEEIAPPVVGNRPWLEASARQLCGAPLETTTSEKPLPALGPGETPKAG
jgi:hypothetical protein